MRSYGHLWQKMISEDGLLEAWQLVRRGHSLSVTMKEYAKNLSANLQVLRTALLEGSYRPSDYRQFRIFDPKPRTISCAPVVDRIVHHALCGQIAPLLERGFIETIFACRTGKGAHRACALARRYARRYRYFCKIDIRHYFDTIDHDRLLEILLPKFRETEVQNLIESIVRFPFQGQKAGKGLPIGNLTSQWFANAYLDAFDHLAVQGFWPCRSGERVEIGYLRYMDDMVFFCDSKAAAWRLHDAARCWLAEKRGLELKDEATVVAPVTEGVPFLGLRIFTNCWRLSRARFLRTRRTFGNRVRQYEAGQISEERLAQYAASSDGALRWFGFKGILEDLALGEGSGSNRVKRGGSWNNNANNCTSSNRNNNNPSNENNNNGFRLSSTLQDEGSHPMRPAFRSCGNEHAPSGRPVAAATVAPDKTLERKTT